MPVDEDLLAAAKTAGDRFTAAERDADLARADYHHAVRRLHLAGASLRDVAQALGISHQRVQQIVKATGGTWWSFIWRGRNVRPDMICSFCGRPSTQVAKLIAGPRVYICDACVGAAEQVLPGESSTEGTPERSAGGGGGPMELVPFDSRVRCSFCRQKSVHVLVKVKQKSRDAAPPDDVAAYTLAHPEDRSRLEVRVVKSGGKAVCSKCLQICRRILDDRSHAA